MLLCHYNDTPNSFITANLNHQSLLFKGTEGKNWKNQFMSKTQKERSHQGKEISVET